MSDPHVSVPSRDADEPTTPMWLPAVGAAIFVALGVAWAFAEKTPESAGPASAASASASAPGMAAPAAGGGGEQPRNR